jgi:hypothetical protein
MAELIIVKSTFVQENSKPNFFDRVVLVKQIFKKVNGVSNWERIEVCQIRSLNNAMDISKIDCPDPEFLEKLIRLWNLIEIV